MIKHEKVLDEFGGEKGIQKLAQAAASAGDVAAAVKEAEESAAAARGLTESAREEAGAARKEAEEAKKEAASAKEEAAAAEEEAGRLAADKVCVRVTVPRCCCVLFGGRCARVCVCVRAQAFSSSIVYAKPVRQ